MIRLLNSSHRLSSEGCHFFYAQLQNLRLHKFIASYQFSTNPGYQRAFAQPSGWLSVFPSHAVNRSEFWVQSMGRGKSVYITRLSWSLGVARHRVLSVVPVKPSLSPLMRLKVAS